MGILYILLIIAQVLILVGALNWGLVAYHIDIVKCLFKGAYVSLVYKLIVASALLVISIRLYNCLVPFLQIK
jgi:uncharacterized membrane protein YuzA (DUF378 family)